MHRSLENNYKKLVGDYDELLKKCSLLTFEQLNNPISAGKWSVAQILTHINLSIGISTGYLIKKLQKPENIPPANLSTVFRSILLNWALKSDLKFKAPKGLDIVPESISLEVIESDWTSKKMLLFNLLEAFPDSLLKKAVFRHPVAGRIKLNNTLEFIHLHLKHHERQIERHLSYVK